MCKILKIAKELLFLGIFSVFIFESSAALNVTNCSKAIEMTCKDVSGICGAKTIEKVLERCIDTPLNTTSRVFEYVSAGTAGLSFFALDCCKVL